jgi:hypothetical protein
LASALLSSSLLVCIQAGARDDCSSTLPLAVLLRVVVHVPPWSSQWWVGGWVVAVAGSRKVDLRWST